MVRTHPRGRVGALGPRRGTASQTLVPALGGGSFGRSERGGGARWGSGVSSGGEEGLAGERPAGPGPPGFPTQSAWRSLVRRWYLVSS